MSEPRLGTMSDGHDAKMLRKQCNGLRLFWVALQSFPVLGEFFASMQDRTRPSSFLARIATLSVASSCFNVPGLLSFFTTFSFEIWMVGSGAMLSRVWVVPNLLWLPPSSAVTQSL